jgi:hypothetical protein
MMGGWLARLKNEEAPNEHATKPTKPPQGEGAAGFVGFVAYPAAPFQKIGAGDSVAVKPEAQEVNEGPPSAIAPTNDPDRWCWPHSVAGNSKEIGTFMSRLARFTDKGLSYDDAQRLADKLVIRDREGDDRRLCLECAHLKGLGCHNWQQAQVGEHLPRDLVAVLQRCGGYQ